MLRVTFCPAQPSLAVTAAAVHGVVAFFIVLVSLVAILAAISAAMSHWSRTRITGLGESAVSEFRGGMSLEIPFYGARRLNATGGAVLQVSNSGLWLGTATIAIRADRQFVEYSRQEVAEVFPCRGWLTRGVGIATREGRIHYLWTRHQGQVLNALTNAGYVVGPPRRPKSVLIDQLPVWWIHRSTP